MRTTVDIEDDLLLAVKAVAHRRRVPLGRVISELIRKSIVDSDAAGTRNGVPQVPVQPGSRAVTPELVRRLLHADP
jgi:hypothetical protein